MMTNVDSTVSISNSNYGVVRHASELTYSNQEFDRERPFAKVGHVIDIHIGISARHAHDFALLTYKDIDVEKLSKAYQEALVLIRSSLFESCLVPDISVDQYGEFSFCHLSDAGYLDIGVRGEGELSYHIRNDKSPDCTRFGDVNFSDYAIPSELINAVSDLKKHLR